MGLSRDGLSLWQADGGPPALVATSIGALLDEAVLRAPD